MLVIVVGGIPIAMPTVLSVTLALGAFKLAKDGAIVARMSAVEEMAGIGFCGNARLACNDCLQFHCCWYMCPFLICWCRLEALSRQMAGVETKSKHAAVWRHHLTCPA